MKLIYDVIIVGAGAAGIACAQKFQERGINFLILEARNRVGGRMFNCNSNANDSIAVTASPIELGAEFIHGAPPRILDWMQKLDIPFYDVTDNHLIFEQGNLTSMNDYFEKIEKVMQSLRSKGSRDRSIEEFLNRRKDKKITTLFKSFVEGFHAADLKLLGERGLSSTEEADESKLNGSQLFRPSLAYDSMLWRMAVPLIETRRLRMQTVLKGIEWEKGNVELSCDLGFGRNFMSYRCKKLILSLPLGVLKSSLITWNKLPEGLSECLEFLQMGHVQRIVFRFKSRFWEKLSTEPIAFLHCRDSAAYFPTWWTQYPIRKPILVAWQGGPKAFEISSWSEEKRVNLALKTLAVLTGKTTSYLQSQLQSYHTHNWTTDPFSLGAYSYIAKNGMSAAARFRKPFENTIYFAGEAAAIGSARGTVHGAFESGYQLGNSSAFHFRK